MQQAQLGMFFAGMLAWVGLWLHPHAETDQKDTNFACSVVR